MLAYQFWLGAVDLQFRLERLKKTLDSLARRARAEPSPAPAAVAHDAAAEDDSDDAGAPPAAVDDGWLRAYA